MPRSSPFMRVFYVLTIALAKAFKCTGKTHNYPFHRQLVNYGEWKHLNLKFTLRNTQRIGIWFSDKVETIACLSAADEPLARENGIKSRQQITFSTCFKHVT